MSQEIAESDSLSHFKIFYNLKGSFKNKCRVFLRQESGLLSVQIIKIFYKIVALIMKIFTVLNIQPVNVIHKCTMICMVNYVKIV